MDVVVYLALIVLVAVFIFSLFVLLKMCRRRKFGHYATASNRRFSQLLQDDMDDIKKLGPHISHALRSNQWVEEISGILQHCVAVMKLCHMLIDAMSKIELEKISSELNEIVCKGSLRIAPQFETLLRSLASENVNLHIIEARVHSLVSSCWALVTPFMAIDRRNYEGLIHLIEEMDRLHKNLQESLYCVEDEYNMLKKKEIKHSAQRSTSKRNITIPDEDETLVSKKKLENGNLQRRPISLTKENINSTEEPDEPPFIT